MRIGSAEGMLSEWTSGGVARPRCCLNGESLHAVPHHSPKELVRRKRSGRFGLLKEGRGTSPMRQMGRRGEINVLRSTQ